MNYYLHNYLHDTQVASFEHLENVDPKMCTATRAITTTKTTPTWDELFHWCQSFK